MRPSAATRAIADTKKACDLKSERRSGAKRRKPQMRGCGCADIGKVRDARRCTGSERATEHQHRNLLARVIGTRPGRIASMIGSDDEQVVSSQARQQFRKSAI